MGVLKRNKIIMNNRNLLIKNNTSFSTSDIMEYLAGYGTKLEGKVFTKMTAGADDGYDTCTVNNTEPSRAERWGIG